MGKFEEVAPFVSGKRGRQVFLNGDKDYGVWTAGQVIGLIHDVPTCQDLVSRIEKEAIETLSSASSLIVDKQPETDILASRLVTSLQILAVITTRKCQARRKSMTSARANCRG